MPEFYGIESSGIVIGDKKKVKKACIRIRQWRIERRSGKHCLVGEVVSHPRLIEGE